MSENEGSSRMRIDRPAARVPPAEHPPRMNPFLRETQSASTFAIAYQINFRGGVGISWSKRVTHFKAAELSFNWVGNR